MSKILDLNKTRIKRTNLIEMFNEIDRRFGQSITIDTKKHSHLFNSFPELKSTAIKIVKYFTLRTSYNLIVHLSYQLAPDTITVDIIDSPQNIGNKPVKFEIYGDHIHVSSIHKIDGMDGFSTGKEIMRFVEEFATFLNPRLVTIYDDAHVSCKDKKFYPIPLSAYRFLTKDDVTTSWYNTFGQFKSTTFNPTPYQNTKVKEIYDFINALLMNRYNKNIYTVSYYRSDNAIGLKNITKETFDDKKELVRLLKPYLNLTLRQTLERANCEVQSALTTFLYDNRIIALADKNGNRIASYPDLEKWINFIRAIAGERYWYISKSKSEAKNK